jgi:hypothetical protein
MDCSVQLRHLAEAERHIASGVEHIFNQEQRIADLDFRGQDSRLARSLLSWRPLFIFERHLLAVHPEGANN